ncbi:hypothetical protein GF406_18150 [candidate division KSB1 bacterium]|nr:hypothetical protein [candidate division KSB1 bacterium]
MRHRDQVPEHCPHCGRKLSPWEQVLLSVDRALMCKGCWYRILLDTYDHREPPKSDEQSEEPGDQS